MSSSSKVELHILLDKNFVLLYRWLHLDQRKKVRWKITYLLGQQGEGLIKENVTSKPDVLVLSPCNPYWDSSVQATLMKFYKLPFQMQCGGSGGWWGQKPFLVISYPSHREGVSCKSRQRKKGKKKKPKPISDQSSLNSGATCNRTEISSGIWGWTEFFYNLQMVEIICRI